MGQLLTLGWLNSSKFEWYFLILYLFPIKEERCVHLPLD